MGCVLKIVRLQTALHSVLISLAFFFSVRYMLGLDQKTLRPLSPGADDGSGDSDGQDENERLDRERLAWTCALILIHRYDCYFS